MIKNVKIINMQQGNIVMVNTSLRGDNSLQFWGDMEILWYIDSLRGDKSL